MSRRESEGSPGRDTHGISRRQALRITAVAGVALALGGGLTREILRRAGLHRIRRTRTQLGTRVTITVVHPDPDVAGSLVAATFGEIERLESLLSRYRPGTPVSRLARDGIVRDAPPELLEVLGRAQAISERTDGAFDVTVAPLLELYRERTTQVWRGRRSSRSGRAGREPSGTAPAGADLPTRDEVEAALARVDYRRLRLEPEPGVVALERPGMALTLDGIAKGYVVDQAVAALVDRGAGKVLVEAGGDLAARGPSGGVDAQREARESVASRGAGGGRSGDDPGEDGSGEGWEVAVQDPHDRDGTLGVLRLRGKGVASSGDYVHAFTQDRRHHHILDPRTGRSPDHTSGVTVVAPSAMDADALSTAAFVLGPRDGLALLEGTEGVEGLIVGKDGSRVSTGGFGAGHTL